MAKQYRLDHELYRDELIAQIGKSEVLSLARQVSFEAALDGDLTAEEHEEVLEALLLVSEALE